MSSNRGATDRAANIAVIGLCIVLVGDMIYRRVGPSAEVSASASTSTGPSRGPIAEYRPGEVFEPVPGLALSSGRASLLVVVRDGCIYCTQSLPFYQRLVETIRRDNARVDLIGVCPETSDACLGYFRSNDVGIAQAVGVSSAAALRVPGTPTLILVDEGGRVEGAWVGRLSTAREQAVLDAVKRRAGN